MNVLSFKQVYWFIHINKVTETYTFDSYIISSNRGTRKDGNQTILQFTHYCPATAKPNINFSTKEKITCLRRFDRGNYISELSFQSLFSHETSAIDTNV